MRFQLSSTLATAILLLASGTTALSDDQQNALNIHNQARATHGIAPLSWDDGLAAGAQDWANQLTGIGHLQHSQAGENLYWQSWASGDALARGAQAWVDEAPNYHGERIGDGDFGSYGHYTQVMWTSTQRVGMASAVDGNGNTYVVARYDPVGNYVGQTPF